MSWHFWLCVLKRAELVYTRRPAVDHQNTKNCKLFFRKLRAFRVNIIHWICEISLHFITTQISLLVANPLAWITIANASVIRERYHPYSLCAVEKRGETSLRDFQQHRVSSSLVYSFMCCGWIGKGTRNLIWPSRQQYIHRSSAIKILRQFNSFVFPLAQLWLISCWCLYIFFRFLFSWTSILYIDVGHAHVREKIVDDARRQQREKTFFLLIDGYILKLSLAAMPSKPYK